MAEQVTGIIGQEQVLLNNAASEATLRLLLEATRSTNKEAAVAIDRMAAKAGIDSKAIETVNTSVKASSTSFKNLNSAVDAVTPAFDQLKQSTQHLTSGVGSASAVLEVALSRATGAVGLFATGLIALLKFQEQSLNSYRELTKSGVNFSGSLTDMRLAAASTYMTLAEFTNVVKNNGEALAKMGTSVNDGVQKFKTLSNTFLSSEAGTNLMALGYTAEEVNNGLITFASSTGRAANGQIASTESITKATAAYLTELDAITQFTGTSRKQLEDDQKKAAAQAAFQRKLASMAPEDAAKLKAAYDQASASGIKGATDLVMSTALGLPPMTEAARTLSGVLPDAAAGVRNMTTTAMQHNSTMDDVNKAAGQMAMGAKKNAEQLGASGDAITMMPGVMGEVVNSGIAVQNKMNAKGIQTADEYAKAFKDIGDSQTKQQKSQAEAAVKTEQAMKDLGIKIYQALLPIIDRLLPVANTLVHYFITLAETILNHKTIILELIAVLAAYKVAQLASFAFEKVKQIKENGLVDTLKKSMTGVGLLGSKTNPMYVIIVGGGAGGLAESIEHGLEGKGGGKAGKAGGFKGGLKSAIKGGVGGIVGGLALDFAGSVAKEKGYEKTGAGLDAAGEALSGASTGAMLGSLIGPVGTIIGGALGGVLGGGYSLYKNWDTITGKSKSSEEGKEKKEPPKMAEGGIVNTETLLTAGESGPEAIIPLSKLGQMLSGNDKLQAAYNQADASGLKSVTDLVKRTALDLPPMTEETLRASISSNIKSIGPGPQQSLSTSISPVGDIFERMLKSFEKIKQPNLGATSSLIPNFESALSTLKNVTPAGILLDNIGDQITESIKEIIPPKQPNEEKTIAQLELLNKTMQDLVKYVKDTADNTDKTHKATKSLGSIW